MSFLEKDSQVFDIKLTQHGKSKLADGNFKPVFYQFFDDDVIYDYEYAGISENQSEIYDRIKDSLRLEAIPESLSVEEKDHLTPEQRRTFNDLFLLKYALGTSELGERKAPAFEISFLDGKLENYFQNYSSSIGLIPIPQLSSSITFESYVLQGTRPTEDELIDNNGIFDNGLESSELLENFVSNKYADGTFIKIDGEHLLLEIQEHNSLFENENFEVEVFLVEEDMKNRPSLKQLYFSNGEEIGEDNVEYYLDIIIDDDIADSDFFDVGLEYREDGDFVRKLKDNNRDQVLNVDDPYNDPNSPEDIC